MQNPPETSPQHGRPVGAPIDPHGFVATPRLPPVQRPDAAAARPGVGDRMPPGIAHPTWHAPFGQHPYPVPPPAVHAWLDSGADPAAVVGSMWRPAAESGPPARLVAWGQRHAGPSGRVRRGTVMVGALASALLAAAAAMMLV